MEQIKHEIPQHLIDKWTKEAEELYPRYDNHDINIALTLAARSVTYIQGCKSTYIEMVGEQERLKVLCHVAYDSGKEHLKNKSKFHSWESFAKRNNL